MRAEELPDSIKARLKHDLIYRPMDGGIEIVRVLHGARDIDAALTG